MAEPWTPYDDKIAGPRYDHEDMCFDLGAQEGYRARLAEEHEPTLACVYCYEAGEANAHTDPLWPSRRFDGYSHSPAPSMCILFGIVV